MSAQNHFALVGLTGGIASGKSLVARRLAELGAALVDADLLAREIVEPDQPAWHDIRQTFGEEVIRPDRTLDRRALGEIIFNDPQARKKLEAITHPRIAQHLMQRVAQLRAAGHKWVVYDAALLVENNAQSWLNALIVVALEPEAQLKRLIARDGLSPEEAQRRIDAQMPLANKIKVADFVIDNNGTRQETLAQVDRIFAEIERRLRETGAVISAPDINNE